MRRSTFETVREILKDYPGIDKYIEQRKEEIKFPYRSEDLNRDIKGSLTNNAMDGYIITQEQDKRLIALERQKNVINKVYSEANHDQQVIIDELYFKKHPLYTPQGLAENVLCISRSQLYKLRNEFFVKVAVDLGLPL